MTPEQAITRYFNFNGFRPGQEEIISSIMEGNSVVVVLPTGAGKSLCYQVPSLISDNFSVVVSPLIALMKDQVDSLNRQENIASFINSTMNYYEAEEVLQQISFGKIKILYVSPERLENIQFAERIKKLAPPFLFVDEAHCISEWGHNFRPSYVKIKDFIEFTGIKKVSAFTATATPEVVKDIVLQLNLKDPKVFVRGFERENLHLNSLITSKKNEKTLELIRQFGTPAIVYTASRKKAEEISEYLVLHGINCSYYHAGSHSVERKIIQDKFLNGDLPVIAATNAFGMGIDKKDIRVVIHYNTPGSIENYYQEIGRAGRDGRESNIFLLHYDHDISIQQYFINNSYPDKFLIQNIYSGLCDYAQVAEGDIYNREISVSTEFLSAYTKREISRGILYSALKTLEAAGYLSLPSEYNNKTLIKFIVAKNQLQNYVKNLQDNALKSLLVFLLREFGSRVFSGEISIFLQQISLNTGILEEQLNNYFILLENLGILEYNPPISRESVLMKTPRVPVNRLQINYKRLSEAYLNAQRKLDLMVNFVFTKDCRFRYILKYFGEDAEDYRCGKCDNCLQKSGLSDETVEYLKENILRTVHTAGGMLNQTMLIRTLRGTTRRENLKIQNTYGICAYYSRDDLVSVIQILKSLKYVTPEPFNPKLLKLTADGFSFLKDKKLVDEAAVEPAEYEDNLDLFNRLKEARKEIARKFSQSSQLVCPDETLRAISSAKPVDKDAMLSIPGFNIRMFNKVGDEFLQIIASFLSNKKLPAVSKDQERRIPENITETLNLLKKGCSVRDIASLRNLSEAVISMQIETILDYFPDLSVDHLFIEDHLNKIFVQIEKGYKDLKDLKNRLPQEISYPLIRIGVAKYKANLKLSISAITG